MVGDSYGLYLDQAEAQGSTWPRVNFVEVDSAVHKATVNPGTCMLYTSPFKIYLYITFFILVLMIRTPESVLDMAWPDPARAS